jgi:hypothetical protein
VHALPHAPQSLTLDVTSMHAAPQAICHVGHLHSPPWQVSPVTAHALPQALQFLTSDVRSMHAAPQAVCPAGQLHPPY